MTGKAFTVIHITALVFASWTLPLDAWQSTSNAQAPSDSKRDGAATCCPCQITCPTTQTTAPGAATNSAKKCKVCRFTGRSESCACRSKEAIEAPNETTAWIAPVDQALSDQIVPAQVGFPTAAAPASVGSQACRPAAAPHQPACLPDCPVSCHSPDQVAQSDQDGDGSKADKPTSTTKTRQVASTKTLPSTLPPNSKASRSTLAVSASQLDRLAAERQNLAGQLTHYLLSGQQDANHIHKVLLMSLDVSAENALRAALKQAPQKKAASHPTTETTCKGHVPSQTVTRIQQIPETVQRVEQEMRNTLARMQHDLFAVSESVRELRQSIETSVHRSPPPVYAAQSRWHDHPAPEYRSHRSIAWSSTPAPNNPAADGPSVAELRERIRQLEKQLEKQLQSHRHPTTRSACPFGCCPAYTTPAVSEPLRPIERTTTPLQPVPQPPEKLAPRSGDLVAGHPPLERRLYYIADLISPPWANSTARVVHEIKKRVAADSWTTPGRYIEVVEPAITLNIRQTPEHHRQIAHLLEALKRQQGWLTDSTNRRAIFRYPGFLSPQTAVQLPAATNKR